jgi:hypothetical protein
MSPRVAFGLLSLAGPCGVRTFRRSSSGLAPTRRGRRAAPLVAVPGLRAAADTSFPTSPYTADRLRRFREFERVRTTSDGVKSTGQPSRVEMKTEDSHPPPDVKEKAMYGAMEQRREAEIGYQVSSGPAGSTDGASDDSVAAGGLPFDVRKEYASHDAYLASVLEMRGDPLESASDRIVVYRGSPTARLMVRRDAKSC